MGRVVTALISAFEGALWRFGAVVLAAGAVTWLIDRIWGRP